MFAEKSGGLDRVLGLWYDKEKGAVEMRSTLWLVLCLCLVLCGCRGGTEYVPVAHSAEEITRVEFVDQGFGEVLGAVTDAEGIARLVAELRQTPVKRHFNDPPFSYGDYVIALYCTDGSVELFGESAMGVVRDDVQDMDGWRYLGSKTVADLFLRYAGVDIELRDQLYR